MGFWGNLADEAGKKTGKAIGNALFGKNAADQVIDVRGGISNNGSSGGSSQASLAQEIEAEGKAKLHTAEANAIDEETSRKQNEAARKAYEQCLNSLQQFYDSFNFDLTNSEEIEQKCLAIISWLDTVDWSAKEKASNFYCDGNFHKVNDTSRAKAETLIKQLSLGVERLQTIGSDSSHLDFINLKLKFYLDRQAQELQQVAKRKSTTRKVFAIIGIVLALGGAITGLILGLSEETHYGDKCKAKVVKYIKEGKLDKACNVMLAYTGYEGNDDYNDARNLLCEELLKKDDLDNAIKIEKNKHYDYAYDCHNLIGEYMINHGMYDEAKGFRGSDEYYIKACIRHMCENNKINEARKFLKRESLNIDSRYRQNFVRDMNIFINSYL